MAKVRWSKGAIEGLKDICRFIALDSPFYAKIFNDRIFEMVEHLETYIHASFLYLSSTSRTFCRSPNGEIGL